jgi:hypothetical protein
MAKHPPNIHDTLVKGKLEGKVKVVINLFDEGFEMARIAKFFEMPEEDIANILKNNGKLR